MVIGDFSVVGGHGVPTSLPLLDVDESVRFVRCDYRGEPSILCEVLGQNGDVSEQLMFQGLGRYPCALAAQFQPV